MPAPPDHVAAASRLFAQLLELSRGLHAFKAEVSSRSAHTLLFPLVLAGPVRTTALAEAVRADPSTTSRQVAELVAEGLVARRPDPHDGRASLLVVTEAGQEAVGRLRAERAELFSQVLAAWSPQEVDALATSMDRFTTDLMTHLTTSPEDR